MTTCDAGAGAEYTAALRSFHPRGYAAGVWGTISFDRSAVEKPRRTRDCSSSIAPRSKSPEGHETAAFRQLRGREAPKGTRLRLRRHPPNAQQLLPDCGDDTRMSPDRSRRPMVRAETPCRLRVVQYREKSIRPQGPSLVLSGPRSQTSTPPMQSAGRSFARLSSRRTSATCSPCNQCVKRDRMQSSRLEPRPENGRSGPPMHHDPTATDRPGTPPVRKGNAHTGMLARMPLQA